MGFFSQLGEVWKRLISKEEIEKATGISVAISPEMSGAINLWSALYENKAPWLTENIKSLNLSAAIASELARMVTLEMKSEIMGGSRAEYLQGCYDIVLQDLRRYVEYGCAKGGIVFKPFVSAQGLVVEYIQNHHFFPIAYDSQGVITGAVFVSQVNLNHRYYSKIEKQWVENEVLHIQNTVYESSIPETMGRQVSLATVPQWADLQPESTLQNINRPLFAYFKVPQANTVDSNSPLGVSVYARAVDVIHQADEQYSRTLWEYEGGEMAIHADESLFRRDDKRNMILPKGRERLFRVLASLEDDKGKLQAWAPELRDESLFRGLNELFMRIEDLCGLARGTFSDPAGEARTATELKILKQRSYATVTDIQMALERALKDLIDCMDKMATALRVKNSGEGAYEISFAWDDSIVVDAEIERAQDLQEIRDGILQKWEYRAKWYGEDEKTAKAMIRETSDNENLMGFGGED